MPVYNALPFLDEAIESILSQSYKDFRLAIYDDHSTDGSFETALEWARKDPRISVVRGDARLGPSGSSNAAARLAQTELVARMDADDVAYPDRLELEVKALRDHPEAVMVGSTFDWIDGHGRILRRAVVRHQHYPWPPIAHASLFYRREAFERAGAYRSDTDYYEDQDLYTRMAAVGDILVVNRPLIAFRFAGQHARLRDDREMVIEHVHRFLHGGVPPEGARSTAPMAFYIVATLAIQAAVRPRLIGLMARKVHFRQPLRTIAVFGMIALGEVAPRLARSLNLMSYRLRDHGAHRAYPEGSVYRWRAKEA